MFLPINRGIRLIHPTNIVGPPTISSAQGDSSGQDKTQNCRNGSGGRKTERHYSTASAVMREMKDI